MDNHELERRVRAIETRLERHEHELAGSREARDRFMPVLEDLAASNRLEKELRTRGQSRGARVAMWLSLGAVALGTLANLALELAQRW